VNGSLVTVTIVLSLVLAGWSLLTTVRNRPPDRTHLVGLAILEVALLILAGWAVAAWAGGEQPAEAGTFLGYLVTLVCLPPLAGVLARMEPTRWGSVIVTVVCLVIPVVVLRLQQTWQAPGV
jgi:nucleoside recognition membrane protein YjiH